MDLESIRTWATSKWVEGLQAVLESMISATPEVTWSPTEEMPDANESAWWSQTLSILPDPAIWVGASAESWKALGVAVLSALGIDDAEEEDIRATCRDLVAQANSAFAGKLVEEYKTEVSASNLVVATQPSGTTLSNIVIVLGENSMKIGLTLALQERLFRRLAEFAGEGEPEQEETVDDEAPQLLTHCIADLHLRMDVVLGRTTLPLNKVYQLNVGSIIDLGRLITEPVDLVITDRIVARGQVVVCNGNYGVKVVSKQSAEYSGEGSW